MKKLTVLLVAFVLGSTQLFATGGTPVDAEKELRNHIAVLLKSPEIKLDKEELKANIEFTLNSKKEIVVLTVNAEESIVTDYVKSRLNYKKVNSEISKIENKVFKIALKILKNEEEI